MCPVLFHVEDGQAEYLRLNELNLQIIKRFLPGTRSHLQDRPQLQESCGKCLY